AEEAIAAAERLCCPVAVKAVHPDLVHKSDAGGVRLNLTGPHQVGAAAIDLLALAPGATLLVQRQATGVEVIVGGVRDPQFGPMVMVGLGGVLVEVVGDVAFGVAPLDRAEALRLIDSLHGRPVLAGARGAEAVDLDALAGVLAAAGDLMSSVPEIAELDLNPVLATPDGCLAVDWRIRVDFSPGQDE
ncbi:MAG: acetate--CoA ligase family protein, partial [Actinomycetota bacterium]|nr:acetate--CoA ligase family protein [Actinomycetota bacterium]